jgi:hypothetical protein
LGSHGFLKEIVLDLLGQFAPNPNDSLSERVEDLFLDLGCQFSHREPRFSWGPGATGFLPAMSLLVKLEARAKEPSEPFAPLHAKDGRTMEPRYAITHTDDDQWLVSVDGEGVMVCKHKRDAVKAADDAAELLDGQPIVPFHVPRRAV